MRTELRIMMKGMCCYMCMCEENKMQMEMCGSAMHDFKYREKI